MTLNVGSLHIVLLLLSLSLAACSGAQHPGQAVGTTSSHRCVGNVADYHSRSCSFSNVCFDTNTQAVTYFASSPLSNPEWRVNPSLAMRGWGLSWEPAVLISALPPKETVTWIHEPVVLFTVPSTYLTQNFGHVVFDILYPIVSLLDLFNLYSKEALLMLSSVYTCRSPLCANPTVLSDQTVSLDDYPNFFREHPGIVDLLFNNHPIFPKNYTSTFCMRTLVVGTGFLYPERHPMRSRLLHKAFVRGNVHITTDMNPKFRITVFNRASGRRIVENMSDLVEQIALSYPKVELQVLHFKDGSPSLHEQLKVLVHTDLLISPGGAISCGLIFLKPGATAIVFNYWDPVRNGTFNLDEHNYAYVEHVTVKYAAVGPQDYESTSDKPGCHVFADWRGPLVGCNIRITNLSKIVSSLGDVIPNDFV